MTLEEHKVQKTKKTTTLCQLHYANCTLQTLNS